MLLSSRLGFRGSFKLTLIYSVSLPELQKLELEGTFGGPETQLQ